MSRQKLIASDGTLANRIEVAGPISQIAIFNARTTHMDLHGLSAATLVAIASAALTAMSIIVSLVALKVAYRQSVGWKPVIVPSDVRMAGLPGADHQSLYISLEIWNRRKYPIAVRQVQARVSGVKIRDEQLRERHYLGHTQNNTIYRAATDGGVAPGGRAITEFEARFDDQSVDALRPSFLFEIWYFDPHRNKLKKLWLNHRFFYPFLGWKKSDREREKLRQDYPQTRNAFWDQGPSDVIDDSETTSRPSQAG